MYTDPIADYLTRIRNAQRANHKVVEIPGSNLKREMTKILFDSGYILSYKFTEEGYQGTIKIALKYHPKTKSPAITKIERYQYEDGHGCSRSKSSVRICSARLLRAATCAALEPHRSN